MVKIRTKLSIKHYTYLSTRRSWHHFCNLPQVDPTSEIHLSRVDLQNVQSGLLIWWRKLNLAIDSAWPEKGRVKDVDSVGGHDDLNVLGSLKSVKLIEQLKHCALHFRITTTSRLNPEVKKVKNKQTKT